MSDRTTQSPAVRSTPPPKLDVHHVAAASAIICRLRKAAKRLSDLELTVDGLLVLAEIALLDAAGPDAVHRAILSNMPSRSRVADRLFDCGFVAGGTGVGNRYALSDIGRKRESQRWG